MTTARALVDEFRARCLGRAPSAPFTNVGDDELQAALLERWTETRPLLDGSAATPRPTLFYDPALDDPEPVARDIARAVRHPYWLVMLAQWEEMPPPLGWALLSEAIEAQW